MRLLRGWTRLPGQIRENGVHDLHIASACTLLGDASTYAIPRLHDVEGTAALISSIMLGGSSAFDGLMTCYLWFNSSARDSQTYLTSAMRNAVYLPKLRPSNDATFTNDGRKAQEPTQLAPAGASLIREASPPDARDRASRPELRI